jgi:hypothetical protein
MSVSSHLHRKLQQTLGSDAADDLVNILDSIDGMRGDIAEMRHEHAMFRTEMTGEVRSLRAQMTSVIERGLREQTRFFFVAWSVILAAIIGLYARG